MSIADRLSNYISSIDNNVLRRCIAVFSFSLIFIVIIVGCVIEMIFVSLVAFFTKASEYVKGLAPAVRDTWYAFKELW